MVKKTSKKEAVAPEADIPGLHPAVKGLLNKYEDSLLALGTVDISVRKTSTGIATLDYALMGGTPMNKIIEISSLDAGAGKTSLALKMCAELQRAYPTKIVVYADSESALDDVLAYKIYGLDKARTFVVRPDQNIGAEVMVDIVIDAAMNPGVCAVVLDSVTGLVTEKEMKNEGSDLAVSPVAQLLGQRIKKLNSRQDPNGAPVIFVNQSRRTIGPQQQGGGKIVTSGGKALEFYPSLRMRLARIESIKESKDGPEIGFEVQCLVTKARHSNRNATCTWSVIYGPEGISSARAVAMMALQQGIITRSGSWYNFNDRKWQGLNAVLETFNSEPEFMRLISDSIVYSTNESVDTE